MILKRVRGRRGPEKPTRCQQDTRQAVEMLTTLMNTTHPEIPSLEQSAADELKRIRSLVARAGGHRVLHVTGRHHYRSFLPRIRQGGSVSTHVVTLSPPDMEPEEWVIIFNECEEDRLHGVTDQGTNVTLVFEPTVKLIVWSH